MSPLRTVSPRWLYVISFEFGAGSFLPHGNDKKDRSPVSSFNNYGAVDKIDFIERREWTGSFEDLLLKYLIIKRKKIQERPRFASKERIKSGETCLSF